MPLSLEADRAQDLPHEPQADAPWSETYLFLAVDVERGVTVYAHFGVTRFDKRVWRATAQVVLPGGRVAALKQHGRSPDPARVVGTPALHARCEDAGATWRLVIDGGARLLPDETLRGSLVPDGVPVPLRVDLLFRHAGPIVIPSPVSWGRLHHNVECTADGRVVADDATFDCAGAGYRDHSMGPRDLSPLARSRWARASFADGRYFNAYTVDFRPQGSFTCSHGGPLAAPRDLAPTHLPDLDELVGGRVRVGLRDPEGRESTADGRIERLFHFTHKLPWELCPGTDAMHRAPTDMALVDAVTRWSWNGVEGVGLTEVIMPIADALAVEGWTGTVP